MLTTCPECELPVSDKAVDCPHCGYPLHSTHRKSKNIKQHMRLPNGFGQITKINKNLRNPYRAMITVGKNENGKPICKLLKPQAYFATYNEAYLALAEYNKNPYDLDDVMTVSELYEKWSAEYFEKVAASSKRTITSAWAYCKSVENINVRDLRVRHIKGCIEDCDSKSIKSRIKSMFNIMLDYALEYGIVDKNYARDFKVEKAEADSEHVAFTDEEMNILWKNTSIPLVDVILFQTYTGWRPQELCKIEMANINTDNWTIIGGMKTEAGTDRVVPLCATAKDLLLRLMHIANINKSKYLICDKDGKGISYDKYYKMFIKTLKEIGIVDHRPHDPRKTFVTMCKKAGVDEYAIKYIVGHSISDLTEKTYTDRDVAWLTSEVQKIIAPV